MTVGDGILWSTVLVLIAVAAYQVSVRKRWRSVGKIVGALLLVGAVFVGVLWGWNNFKNRPREVTELGGVRLGMSPLEVKLVKGAPKNEADTKAIKQEDDYRLDWSFQEGDYSPAETVIFYGKTENALKVSIVCESRGYGRVFGLGRGSSEQEVVEKLGKPTRTSIAENGLSKAVSFKPYKVAFAIEKGAVTEICISESGAIGYTREYKSPPEASQK